MYANDIFTLPVNLAGLPGLSVPCGLSEGLPVGLQMIGPAFAENRLLAIGHALERALGFDPVPAAEGTDIVNAGDKRSPAARPVMQCEPALRGATKERSACR